MPFASSDLFRDFYEWLQKLVCKQPEEEKPGKIIVFCAGNDVDAIATLHILSVRVCPSNPTKRIAFAIVPSILPTVCSIVFLQVRR
jgi:hypothetical protein